MGTLGSALAKATIAGKNVTVGAYARYSGSKEWTQYRVQAPGTAGTFVSVDYLIQELGRDFVNIIRQAAKAWVEYDVGTYSKESVLGQPSSLRAGGLRSPTTLPLAGGLKTTGFGGAEFAVTGNIGQLVFMAQKTELFKDKGALFISKEIDKRMPLIIKKMIPHIRQLADNIIVKRVYNQKAVVANIDTSDLGTALKKASISYGSFFGPYEKTGHLRQALAHGIREVADGQGFIVSVDEEFLSSVSGRSYWAFVDEGHRVVLSSRFTGPIDTGRYVVGRPFMEEIQSETKKYVKGVFKKLRASNKEIGKLLGDYIFAWFNNVRAELTEESTFLTVAPEQPYGMYQVKTPLGSAWRAKI